jgi:hypothetical protein
MQQDDSRRRPNVQYSHYLPPNNPFKDSDDLIPEKLYLLDTITELNG